MRAPARRALVSDRVSRIPASGIRRFFDLVASLDGGISLGVGEPDFVTPEQFTRAAFESIRTGETHSELVDLQPAAQKRGRR